MDPNLSWINTLVRKTSAHEGTYWSVQENLDGNGVSYGVLQWTQRSGSLGRLLAAMAAADPAAFADTFGPGWPKLLEATRAASLAPVDGALLWREPWLGRFRAAGRLPVFQAVQVHEATTSDYFTSAVAIARLLGVQSERAMVLYYNRTVHQGPGSALKIARALVSWWTKDPSRRPDAPNDVLAQYAWSCADNFRRTDAPERKCRSSAADCSTWWEPRATEWSELAPGRYTIRRVSVANVWHAVVSWKGNTTLSLYDLIVKRSSEILLDPELSDAPVTLPAVS